MPRGMFARHPELSTEERFWARVVIGDKDKCWEWMGGINENGYSICSYNGKTQKAHRISYSLAIGPIPEGMDLDHLCRNRACVNPYHLEIVTRRVNLLRGEGSTAEYARRTHCPNGHPYDMINTYYHPNRGRYCRICKANYRKEYYEKNGK